MRFALGMDNREIARALGRTDGATKVLIHRAIKQLEEEMRRRWRAEPSRSDVENLLRSALRPIEPPENLPGRVEETLSAVTEAAAEELSAWAEELSESELRSAARPSQLGAPRGRDRGGRDRGRRSGPGRAAPPRRKRPNALRGARGPGLGHRRSGPRPGPEPPRLGWRAPCASPDARRRTAITPVMPEDQVQDVVLVVDGHQLEQRVVLGDEADPVVAGGDEAEDAEDDVEDADEEGGRLARPIRRRSAAAPPIAMWTRLCQPLTDEDPEHVVGPDRVSRREARLVEEADDPGDDEHAADEQAVEPCGACLPPCAPPWACMIRIGELLVATMRGRSSSRSPGRSAGDPWLSSSASPTRT